MSDRERQRERARELRKAEDADDDDRSVQFEAPRKVVPVSFIAVCYDLSFKPFISVAGSRPVVKLLYFLSLPSANKQNLKRKLDIYDLPPYFVSKK